MNFLSPPEMIYYVWELETVSLKPSVLRLFNGQKTSICITSTTLMHKYGFG